MSELLERLQSHSCDDNVDGGLLMEAAEEIERLQAENTAYRNALTPSALTKAAYMGEFTFVHGEDKVYVPWTVIKDIMREIRVAAEAGGEG